MVSLVTMMTTFPRICLLLALSILSLPVRGTADSPDPDLPVMHDLDLHQVQLVVESAPEMKERLHHRATTLLAKAGLHLASPDQLHPPPVARLTITLNSTLLGDTCHGSVLYAPSVALVESVIVPRNGEVMQDATWSAETSPQVRAPLTIENLEHDMDRLITRFIEAYQPTQALRDSQETGNERRTSANPPVDDAPGSAASSGEQNTRAGVSLQGLDITRVQLSVLAGRSTSPLATRALRQLTTAGLPVSLESHGPDAPTLSLEMSQRTIGGDCPGKVLYESGLFLVEPVRLVRNRQIRTWSDTWVRERIQIVPPVPMQQFESDQEALLTQFIRSFKER